MDMTGKLKVEAPVTFPRHFWTVLQKELKRIGWSCRKECDFVKRFDPGTLVDGWIINACDG